MAPKENFQKGPETQKFYGRIDVEEFLVSIGMDTKQIQVIRNRINLAGVGDLTGKFNSGFLNEIFRDNTLVQNFKEYMNRKP